MIKKYTPSKKGTTPQPPPSLPTPPPTPASHQRQHLSQPRSKEYQETPSRKRPRKDDRTRYSLRSRTRKKDDDLPIKKAKRKHKK